MNRKQTWEQGSSCWPQAVDVLSQTSSSMGFIRLPGSWVPMQGITFKRKVISSLHRFFWCIQCSPQMWETEFNPTPSKQVLQPYRSALTSPQPSQDMQADQTHGSFWLLPYPSLYLCQWKRQSPPWNGLEAPCSPSALPSQFMQGVRLPCWEVQVYTYSIFLHRYTEVRERQQSLP